MEPAARPTCTGPPFRGLVPLLGKVTPRVKEQLAVRQQAREIAGQLRQSMPPRPRGIPQTRPVHPPPRVTVTLPSPQPDRSATHGRRGRGRGGGGQRPGSQHPQHSGQEPRGLLTLFPERWGPRPRWSASSRHSSPPGRPFTDDAYVLTIIRGGFVVELSEPLLGAVVRLPTPRMPPHIRAGMAAEITALLSKGVIEPRPITRDFACRRFFSAPSTPGTFA